MTILYYNTTRMGVYWHMVYYACEEFEARDVVNGVPCDVSYWIVPGTYEGD